MSLVQSRTSHFRTFKTRDLSADEVRGLLQRMAAPVDPSGGTAFGVASILIDKSKNERCVHGGVTPAASNESEPGTITDAGESEKTSHAGSLRESQMREAAPLLAGRAYLRF